MTWGWIVLGAICVWFAVGAYGNVRFHYVNWQITPIERRYISSRMMVLHATIGILFLLAAARCFGLL